MGDNNPPRKGLDEIAKGGDWLDASKLPPRGREYTVVGTDWAANFAKDALVPVLLLDDGSVSGKEHPQRFKVTNRQSATKLKEAGVSTNLEGAEGLKVYLIPVAVTAGGKPVTVGQIAEIVKA